MPTANEPYLIEENGWTVRVRQPDNPTNPRTLLMLHGWTGDETVMWIFAGKISRNTWLFAPRGPIQAETGYAWLPHTGGWHALDEFAAPAGLLMEAFQEWASEAGAPIETFDVMGFSQGAAMAYAMAALYPDRVQRVVALAGFLPRDSQGRYQALNGKPIYVAHGSEDTTIPVKMAQEAVQTLQAAGADVAYCESNVGHKLSANCLRGLETFLA